MIRKRSYKHIAQHWAATTVLALFIVFLLSIISMSAAMAKHSGMGSDCPYMQDQHVVCGMTSSEHKELLESVVTATVREVNILEMLILAVICLSLLATWHARWRYGEQSLAHRIRLRFSLVPDARLFVFWRQFFSQGIIHPKLYPVIA